MEKEIAKQDNNAITSTEVDVDKAPNKDIFLYTYDQWGRKYGVLEDKTLYVVSLEIGLDGRNVHGIFENGKEFVPLGNKEIKKISGQYLLLGETNQSLYTLFFHSGKILYENVKDIEVVNLYNVIIHRNSWEIQYSEISELFSFAKVYFEYGFRILKGEKCLIDDIIIDAKAILYTKEDVFLKARLVNGNIILFSIKNGLILSDYDGENIVDIKVAFSNFRTSHSYISHIVKFGEEFSDETKQKMNNDLWNNNNHPDLYLGFSSNMAVLVKINDSFKILCGNPNDKITDDSLLVDNECFETFSNASDFPIKKAIDPSLVVNDVSFIGKDNEFDANSIVLRIQIADERVGYYSTKKGWIIQPECVKSCDIYEKYLVLNNYIINQGGDKYSFNTLEFISRIDQCSAYYDSLQNSYVIIDSEGWGYNNLQEDGRDNLVSNQLDAHHEYQLVLNKRTKELARIPNPNYKRDDSYYPDSYEWTDEDAWDAMTDGMYGDYPGSGWDPEQFGY